MKNELMEILTADYPESCMRPLSLSVSGALLQKYREVGAFTKAVTGKNRLPSILRARIDEIIDEVRAATEELAREMESKSA